MKHLIIAAFAFCSISSLAAPAGNSTCMAYWEGVYYNVFTKQCEWGSTSGCSNPYKWDSEEACVAAQEQTNVPSKPVDEFPHEKPVVVEPVVVEEDDANDEGDSSSNLGDLLVGPDLSEAAFLTRCASNPSLEECASTETECAGGLKLHELRYTFTGCFVDGTCRGVQCLKNEDGVLYLREFVQQYEHF